MFPLLAKGFAVGEVGAAGERVRQLQLGQKRLKHLHPRLVPVGVNKGFGLGDLCLQVRLTPLEPPLGRLGKSRKGVVCPQFPQSRLLRLDILSSFLQIRDGNERLGSHVSSPRGGCHLRERLESPDGSVRIPPLPQRTAQPQSGVDVQLGVCRHLCKQQCRLEILAQLFACDPGMNERAIRHRGVVIHQVRHLLSSCGELFSSERRQGAKVPNRRGIPFPR
jgi:hypothetical protein